MQSLVDSFTAVFNFFNVTKVAGLSLTTWIVIVLVFSGIGIFVRGNK